MTTISVRAETPEDVRAIDVVNLAAFEGEGEAHLVTALRPSEWFIPELSLVAEFSGRIVGHLLLTRACLEQDPQRRVLALGPMSVVPSQSHRGVGTRLLDEGLKRARAAAYDGVVEAGQAGYYARHGFQSAARWGLEVDLPVPATWVTAFELRAAGLAGGGRVIYPAPYHALFAPAA